MSSSATRRIVRIQVLTHTFAPRLRLHRLSLGQALAADPRVASFGISCHNVSLVSTHLVASPSFSLGLARRRFPLGVRMMQGTPDWTWGPFSVDSSAVRFLSSASRCHLQCRPLSCVYTVGVAPLAAILSLLRCAFPFPQDLFSSISAASRSDRYSATLVPLLATPLSLVPLHRLQSTYYRSLVVPRTFLLAYRCP